YRGPDPALSTTRVGSPFRGRICTSACYNGPLRPICYIMSEVPNLSAVLRLFPGQNILVIGDVILDRYWWGEASRLSPEAPVPVVRKQRSTVRPGGAANTAANLAALGATPYLVGSVGTDRESTELQGAGLYFGGVGIAAEVVHTNYPAFGKLGPIIAIMVVGLSF